MEREAPTMVKKPVGELSAEERAYLTSCYGFAKEFLKLPVYDVVGGGEEVDRCVGRDGQEYYAVTREPWQRQALDLIDENGSRTSVRTANGSGKTSVIVAGSIIWHMAIFPNSLTVSTAGAFRQVKYQLFPALQALSKRVPGWEFRRGNLEIKAPNGSVYLGFSTDDPGKAEGYHGNKDILYDLKHEKGPLLIIIDEAKTVPDEIFEAADRCTYQRLIYASSTGYAEGEFYRSQTMRHSPFQVVRAPASVCPHIDHVKNAEVIDKRGLDHPLVRSTIFAEFMSDPEHAIVSLQWVEKCLADPPPLREEPKVAFCDFAAGGDENVIAVRAGNKVTVEAAWREKDTMAAVGRFIIEFKRLELIPERIFGDNDGLGKVMIDTLHEAGWTVNRESNGAPPHNRNDYFNRGAEIWYDGAEAIKHRRVILPNDQELTAQLASRKGKPDSKGRLKVESKEEMRKRGIASPDRADAVLGVMAVRETLVKQGLGFESPQERATGFLDQIEQSREVEFERSLGIYAG